MRPLEGLRVVEWGGFIAAPYATHLLRELGAQVIKVEPPAGDPARHYGPFRNDRPDPEASGLFLALNAGKQSRVLDVASAGDRQALLELLDGADVLVTDRPLSERRPVGLDADSVRRARPRLVTVSLSVFGEDGGEEYAPQQAIDACAVSGVSHVLGEPTRSPLILPFHQPDFQAGAHGAGAVLLALLARDRSGQGQHVDIASADLLALATSTNGLTFRHYGALRWTREGRRASGSGGAYPYTLLPCKDGLVCLMGRARLEWDRLVASMGQPAWSQEPRFQDLRAMGMSYPDEVDARLIPWLMEHTREELTALGSRFNYPIGPLRTIDEVMASTQLAHRRYFREVPHPALGRVQVPGVPWQVADEPQPTLLPAAPRLDEHPRARWRGAFADPQRHVRDDVPPNRPLAGLRVLDFGWIWSGPLVATVLAEFGADVIKVEHRERLDNMRLRGLPDLGGRRPDGPPIECNPYFNQINHGKDSITVNLKDPRGQALLQRLVPQVDVVLENLTPGALAKSGFGWQQLSALNPALVMMSMSSTGQHGPLNNFRAYAPIMSSHCGLEALVGYPGEEPTGMMNFGYGDPNAAAHALPPLFAALLERGRTGRGRYIDMSQTEAVVSVLAEPVLEWSLNRRLMRPPGNRHRAMAPHGIFPAAGADQWLSIAVDGDPAWQNMVALLGAPAWAAAADLRHTAGRLAAQESIEEHLAAWTRRHERGELVERLRAAGIAASPVMDLDSLWATPRHRARALRVPTQHPYLGEQFMSRWPWQLQATPPHVDKPSPLLGSGNQRVFGELLGLSRAEIDALQAEGVIA